MPTADPPSSAGPDPADLVGAGRPPEYDLSYRDTFWGSRGYEDRCDRIALRALLTGSEGRLLDLGAGFGRLVAEYSASASITLVDTSPTMLDAARTRFGGDPRIEIVAADAAQLPFTDSSFDVVVAVRLLVHFRDPGPLFREIARVLRPGGRLIVEYPNRRHLLAVARYLAGRQPWSPNGLAPWEYLERHFAHHPARVHRQLRSARFSPDAIRAVSLFRSSWLTERASARVLAAVEARLQGPLGSLYPSPSIYVRATRATGPDAMSR